MDGFPGSLWAHELLAPEDAEPRDDAPIVVTDNSVGQIHGAHSRAIHTAETAWLLHAQLGEAVVNRARPRLVWSRSPHSTTSLSYEVRVVSPGDTELAILRPGGRG